MFNPAFPTPHFLPFANLSAARDAIALDPSGKGRSASGLIAGTAGTAVIRPRGGALGGTDDRTVMVPAGVLLPIEFDSIRSGTAVNVTILWARQ